MGATLTNRVIELERQTGDLTRPLLLVQDAEGELTEAQRRAADEARRIGRPVVTLSKLDAML